MNPQLPNNPDGETYCKHEQHADCKECMFDLVWAAQQKLSETLGEFKVDNSTNLKDFLEMLAEAEYPNA
jgi:hypothetical protein